MVKTSSQNERQTIWGLRKKMMSSYVTDTWGSFKWKEPMIDDVSCGEALGLNLSVVNYWACIRNVTNRWDKRHSVLKESVSKRLEL